MKRNITPLRRILKIDGGPAMLGNGCDARFGVFIGFNLQSRRTYNAWQWLCLAAKSWLRERTGYVWQQILELRKRKEKEHLRERKKRGKGSAWETEKQMGFGNFRFSKRGKVARFDLFLGARLSFCLGLWSKLMWLFLDRCQLSIG